MKKTNECFNCGKHISGIAIVVEPNRHATSPNSINQFGGNRYFNYFCSPECRKSTDKERYSFWAELDRNASDSECFVHRGWEGKMRIGYCKITGQRVTVEPLQPGDNSGQPMECYKHFRLHPRYI